MRDDVEAAELGGAVRRPVVGGEERAGIGPASVVAVVGIVEGKAVDHVDAADHILEQIGGEHRRKSLSCSAT